MSEIKLENETKQGNKNKIIDGYKANYVWIISSLIVAIWLFIFMVVFKIAPFGNRSFVGSDCEHQIYPLLAELQDKLHKGESLFYYWNSGLGGDFLPSYFYYVASPTNLLLYFFNKSDINSFICFTVIFKLAFSAGAFGYFLSRRNGINNNMFYIALSCGYALSNYMCSYYYDVMWLDSLMIFPLIILGLDILKKTGKPVLYVFTLSYSLLCNYYLSYIICVFLILWFLMYSFDGIKGFIKDGFRFAFYSILSAGISALPLIVSFIGLTKTVSAREDTVIHEWYGNFFEIVRQQFILTKATMTSYINNMSNIYCGTIVIVLLFTYCFLKDIKIVERVKRIVLLSILFLSMNESILNYIWHGFHKQNSVPNRFAFIFVFLLLLTSADVIDVIKKNNIKSLIIGLFIAELLPIISYCFVDFNSIITSHQVIFLSVIIIIIYGIALFCLLGEGIKKKLSTCFLSVFMIVELIFNSMVVIKYDIIDFTSNTLLLGSMENTINANDKDRGVFRSEIVDSFLDNQNAFHGINGVSIFNSTVNCEISIFLQYMGVHTSTNRVFYDQPIDTISNLMGIQYFYLYSGNKYFNDNNDYTNIYSDELTSVYKESRELALGYAVNDDIKEYSLLDLNNVSNNLNALCSQMTGCTNVLEQVVPEYKLRFENCEVGIGDTDYLSFQYDNVKEDKLIELSFNVKEDGLYYVDIRQENEDNICLKVNDNVIRESIFMTNGLNKAGYLQADDLVSISLTDNKGHAYRKNEDSSEVKVFVYKVNESAVSEFNDLLTQNRLNIDEFNDSNSFRANIELRQNQLLFTSIPYDKGWRVYENGKELETIKVASAFLGVDAGEGNHELQFVFIPEGFYLGLACSCISLVIFIIILIIKKRKNNSDKQSNNSNEVSNI